jgi:hypothetical protein
MSTVCKLDPAVRMRRSARANLLRNPPRINSALAAAIYTELCLIAASPRLTGDTKHALFERGAKQLSGLGFG